MFKHSYPFESSIATIKNPIDGDPFVVDSKWGPRKLVCIYFKICPENCTKKTQTTGGLELNILTRKIAALCTYAMFKHS